MFMIQEQCVKLLLRVQKKKWKISNFDTVFKPFDTSNSNFDTLFLNFWTLSTVILELLLTFRHMTL